MYAASVNEIPQPGLETSNATGENVQRHIPGYEQNSVQQGLINSADGTNPLQAEIINSADATLAASFAPKMSTIKTNFAGTTTVFGLTPMQAGLAAVGVSAAVALIAHFALKA